MATVIGNLRVLLGLDTAKFEAGSKAAQRATLQLQRDVRKFGFQAQDVGRALTAGLTLPLVGIGAAATKLAVDFNKGMANVATLIPGNTARVNELKAAVQDAAVASGTSTSSISEGLYQLVSAFGDSAESAKLLDLNARAAKAGLSTVEDAINLTSAVTKGFGDTSLEANRKVLDLAFTTVKLGQTTFPELAASMGRVVPIAAELGVKQAELFAVMATGTGVTGTTSEVSTQLRGVLQSLLSPTKQMSELLDGLGVSSGKALLEQRGLKGTIDAIVGAAETAGVPLQKFISSIEGQTLALSLAGAQSDTFISKLDQVGNASGSMLEAFDEQTKGLNKVGFTWEQVTIRLQVFAQRLGDVLLPIVGRLLELADPVLSFLEGMISAFQSLSPTTQTAIVAIAALAAAIGPLIAAAGFLITGLAPLIPLIGTVAAAMTGPVGIIAAAVALGTTFFALSEDTTGIWGTIRSTISDVLGELRELFGTVTAAIAQIWETHGEALTNTWDVTWGTVSSILSGAFEVIKGVVKGSLKIIGGLVKIFAGLLTGDFSLMGEGIKDIVSGLWTAVRGIFDGGVKAVTGIFAAWSEHFRRHWEMLKNALLESWQRLWDGIRNYILGPIESIKSGVAGFTDSVTGFFRSMYDKVVGNSFVPDMMEGIKRAFGTLDQIMVRPTTDGVMSVIGRFRSMFDSIVSAAKNWKQSLLSIFGSVIESLIGGAGLLGSLKQGFGGFLGGLGIPGFGGIGGGAGGAAAGGAGGVGLGSIASFLTNPFTIAAIATVLGGIGIYKFLKDPARLGEKETLRDFNIDIGKSDVSDFLKGLGISKDQFKPIRKDILSSPEFFRQVLLPAAQSSGQVDQLIASFGKLEAFGQTFDLSSEAAAAVAGDFSKLNDRWAEIFGSQGLPKFLPTWEKLLVDTTNAVAQAVKDGEALLGGTPVAPVPGPEPVSAASAPDPFSGNPLFPGLFTGNQYGKLVASSAQPTAFMEPRAQTTEIRSEPRLTLQVTINAKDPDLTDAVRDQVVPQLQLMLKTGSRGLLDDITAAVERARAGVRS